MSNPKKELIVVVMHNHHRDNLSTVVSQIENPERYSKISLYKVNPKVNAGSANKIFYSSVQGYLNVSKVADTENGLVPDGETIYVNLLEARFLEGREFEVCLLMQDSVEAISSLIRAFATQTFANRPLDIIVPIKKKGGKISLQRVDLLGKLSSLKRDEKHLILPFRLDISDDEWHAIDTGVDVYYFNRQLFNNLKTVRGVQAKKEGVTLKIKIVDFNFKLLRLIPKGDKLLNTKYNTPEYDNPKNYEISKKLLDLNGRTDDGDNSKKPKHRNTFNKRGKRS